ncbi:MAG TPA: UDP-glucose 4-epimerase GalE [Candidatus Sulfotelmatobacter sp.]|jgi:UDP-glucose 4-epimerase|nr:UDP-glucose 4-epimerase GalE [Candidatus Sulfotelmatobacter sp.]
MTILVTGGAGYIGSVTVERLRANKEDVVVLDDLVYGHREAVDPGVHFYQGKVGDSALLERIAREHQLEACIHFAALASVGESVADPAKYFENNVAQGTALMGSLIRAGVRIVVFSSTCATYGEPKEIPISEQSPQWPKNPYGWSKFCMERLLESYDRAYGLRFAALRYFNAAGANERYGEDHEPETHLIPNILAAAVGEKPEIVVFGNDYPTPDGTPIRDYIHVSDLADAHILALDHLRRGGRSESLNVGTGRGHSVLEVIECARQVTKREIRARIEAPRAGDPARLVANSSRIQTVLGWKPVVSDLRTIVQSAWVWRQRHPKGYRQP